MAEEVFFPTIIIIGAGIFGLSTALSIADRYPNTQITIIDRLTPPVEDSSSVDTTRCIRADYADPVYAALASKAQTAIKSDPELQPYYFEQGMSFIYDGQASGPYYEIWRKGLENARKGLTWGEIVEFGNAEEVFARIHGDAREMVGDEVLKGTGGRKWNKGYCNTEDAFIDARESIRVYYERCLRKPSITFVCGTPVKQLLYTTPTQVSGVILSDNREIRASRTLVACGAWSGSLLDLEGLTYSSAIEVAWLKVTPEEVEKWKNMSITTNLSTGFNLFPPHNGEIKILRRSAGYRNTVTIPHPSPSSPPQTTTSISLPRTVITNPTDIIPLEAELALRENLKEIMPTLAERPFDRTKLCWLSQSPTADFLIANVPGVEGVSVATGGSAHAWKFLPVIGGLVVDCMVGNLDPILERKWRWRTVEERASDSKDGGNAPRMKGTPTELRDVVRTRS